MFFAGDIFADRLGFALDSLGGQPHSGQLVEQRATAIERRLGADQRRHAAHAWRILRRFDGQLLVVRREAFAAAAAVIVRPFDDDLAQHRDELLRPPTGVARWRAAGAGLLRFAGRVFVQQRLEQDSAGLMQRVARRLFDGFEVERPALAPLTQDDP